MGGYVKGWTGALDATLAVIPRQQLSDGACRKPGLKNPASTGDLEPGAGRLR